MKTVTFNEKTHKIVPLEPTTKMVIDAYNCQGEATSKACEEIYSAMVCAAPDEQHAPEKPTSWRDWMGRLGMKVDAQETRALLRFNETLEDGEGYDVPKPMMRRLAEIGLVRHFARGMYGLTEIGRGIVASAAERGERRDTSSRQAEDAAYELGAKGGDPTEEERLLFEAWMRGHCWAVIGQWDGKTYCHEQERHGYVNPGAMATRQLWAAWRDRAALAKKI